MIVELPSTRRAIVLSPEMRRLDAVEYAYHRRLVTWSDVCRAASDELPLCTCCGERPADGGGWTPDERLCHACAIAILS